MGRYGRRVTLLSALRGIERSHAKFSREAERSRRHAAKLSAQRLKLEELQRQLTVQQQRLGNIKISINEETGKLEVTDSLGGPLSRKETQMLWEQQAEAIRALLDRYAAEVNEKREEVLNIFHDIAEFDSPEYEGAEYDGAKPELTLPEEPSFDWPEPQLLRGTLDQVLPFLQRRKERKYADAIEKHRHARDAYEREHNAWREAVSALKIRHDKDIEAYEAAKARHEAAESTMAEEFRYRLMFDVDFMAELFSAELELLSWPRETHVDFEIVAGGKELNLDVDLPEIEEMPTRTAVLADNEKQLKFIKLPEKGIREDYAIHVHGVILRLVGLAFMKLPALSSVVISGYSQRLNKGTGEVKGEYILSISANRSEFDRIDLSNLRRINPIQSIELFRHIRKLSASNQFSAIEPYMT